MCFIDLKEEGYVLLSDFKDSTQAIPDNEFWDSTGSGSGKDGKDSTNDTMHVSTQPQIEAESDEPEVIEVKDDKSTTKDGVSARDSHVGDTITEIYQSENEGTLPRDNHMVDAMKDVYYSRQEALDLANEAQSLLQNGESSMSDIKVHQPEEKALEDEHEEPERKEQDERETSGVPSSINRIPKFQTITEEIRWKFNKARESLKEAKQVVALAELIAAEKHQKNTKVEEIKNIISKTEVALVHAGEKIGLDYVHYKRSIPDDEDDE